MDAADTHQPQHPTRDGGSGQSPPALDLSKVPSALRERAQWVCWRFELRKDKPTKVPVNPATGDKASPTDPSTWGTFELAFEALGRHERLEGMGFVFTADDPFIGVDLDDCIDEAGELVPSARDVIDTLNSYTEISPSGRGVKIFIVGQKPAGAKCRSKVVAGYKETEIYSDGRYFTVTGRHVLGTPLTVEDRQQQLESLCKRLWPAQPATPASRAAASAGFSGDDQELLQKAFAAKNGALFKALWEGDTSLHADDDSAADMALCNLLAFWTGKDPERMDRLFRRSGLFREKWNEKRGERTYGQITIDRAIEGCKDTYSPRGRTSGGDENGSDAAPEPVGGDGGLVSLGQHDPATGRIVLSPQCTLPTAEAYIRAFGHHPEGQTLHDYGGQLMEWRGNRYVQVEEAFLKKRLQEWLHGALRYVKTKFGTMALAEFESNPTTVKQALDTIRAFVHLSASTPSPSWLDGGEGRPPALELLPCKTLNLHIPTGQVLPPTPALFTTNALDFDYDPNPKPPERWIKFLEELFSDDPESVALLQEWFGYCLTGDTSQQKMLLVVGPRRSGKGTIGRILTKLVGVANVVGPTTSSLAGTFGLQPLVDKSLAIVSDARFKGDNIHTLIERLLCISGEDLMTIDRKFLGAISMKLATRFMFLTNELPCLDDVSTALTGRFLVLRLTTSFYGAEDRTLTPQLVTELPGILHWAVEGWRRLKQRGRFVQPASSEDAISDMEALTSPMSAFVRERCVVAPGRRVEVNVLFLAWQAWCNQDGRQVVSSKMSFGRDLSAAVAGIKRRKGSGMVPFYDGIGLRTDDGGEE